MRFLSIILTVLLAMSVALNFYFYAELTLSGVKESVNESETKISSINKPATPIEDQARIKANKAFQLQDTPTALVQLKALNHSDPEQAEALKVQWYQSILGQITTESDASYAQFVQEFLRAHPYDPYFLYLEIELYNLQNNKVDTLLELYQLLKGNLPASLINTITNRISELYTVKAKRLKDLGAWDILSNMIETLIPLEPENEFMLLDLAESYAMQQQFGLMDSVLAYLPQDNEKAEQLRQFKSVPTYQEPLLPDQDAGTPLVKEGDHYIVNAKIGEHYQVSLLIDTGASTTVISQATFDALPGYISSEFVGNYKINTANGQLMAPVYRFSSLSIGDNFVDDIAIVVLPLENMDSDGLLGMNFLRAFRFEIDQQQDMLILAPQKS